MDRQVVSELYERFAGGAVEAFNETQLTAPTMLLLQVRESDGEVQELSIVEPNAVHLLQREGMVQAFITGVLEGEGLTFFTPNVVIHIAEGHTLKTPTPYRGLLVAVHTKQGVHLGVCPITETLDERRAEFQPMHDGVWGVDESPSVTLH